MDENTALKTRIADLERAIEAIFSVAKNANLLRNVVGVLDDLNICHECYSSYRNCVCIFESDRYGDNLSN